jgi:uncharacterized protein YpmS
MREHELNLQDRMTVETASPSGVSTSDRFRPTLRCAFQALGIAISVLAFLALLTVSLTPSVQVSSGSPQETLRLTNTILRNTVPDNRRTVTRKVVNLTADDLATIVNYAFARKQVDGLAQVSIRDKRLRMQAAIKLPTKGVDLYMNLRVIVDDAEPDARVQQLKIGRLALPRPLVGWILKAAAHTGPFARFGQIADEVVRRVRIADQAVRIDFDWNREALARADDLVTDVALRARMQAYYQPLAELVSQAGVKRYVRLPYLLQPLFQVAQKRSASGSDPIEENRALILMLNAYVNGRDMEAMLGWPPPDHPIPKRSALLQRRVDLAQHFITSAALAVAGTKTLADVVGMAKELNDTHSGSGFSFVDLAADRAGAHFGKFAVRSDETARKVQTTLSSAPDEALFMPSTKDLPENLKAAEFQQRFKTIGSPEFTAMKEKIEALIAACPIYLF